MLNSYCSFLSCYFDSRPIQSPQPMFLSFCSSSPISSPSSVRVPQLEDAQNVRERIEKRQDHIRVLHYKYTNVKSKKKSNESEKKEEK